MKACRTCQRQFVDLQEVCPLDETPLHSVAGKQLPGLGRVLGNYRLICLLGEGGMGNIYIGAHTRINRYVAIKVLRPELQNRKEAIARFFAEANAVNRIKHPNIVESIDLVEDVVDGAYCVLELLKGPDLKTRLASGPLPFESAIHVGAQIADALAAVHSLDIVHRDLKPDNLILINRGGRDDFVKLIDFGVAQISEEGQTGIPFGTAAYMAPEQAAGERVDGRADVYALGILLFEMATGKHPLPASSDNEYILRHADDTPPRPSKFVQRVPRDLEAIIMRCLAKKPEQRYESAAAVAVALRAVDVKVVAKPAGSGRWKWAVGGTLFTAAAIATAVIAPRYLTADSSRANAAPPAAPVVQKTAAPERAATEEAAPLAPPPQQTIALSFATVPPGAAVYREGETVPLGTTPFAITLPKSDRALRIRFELDGYEPVEEEVAQSAANQLEIKLKALPKEPVQRPGVPFKKKTPVSREGVMDPFAN